MLNVAIVKISKFSQYIQGLEVRAVARACGGHTLWPLLGVGTGGGIVYSRSLGSSKCGKYKKEAGARVEASRAVPRANGGHTLCPLLSNLLLPSTTFNHLPAPWKHLWSILLPKIYETRSLRGLWPFDFKLEVPWASSLCLLRPSVRQNVMLLTMFPRTTSFMFGLFKT